MLPSVGFFLAAYVITEMACLIERRSSSPLLKVLAGITIIVAVVSCFDMYQQGF